MQKCLGYTVGRLARKGSCPYGDTLPLASASLPRLLHASLGSDGILEGGLEEEGAGANVREDMPRRGNSRRKLEALVQSWKVRQLGGAPDESWLRDHPPVSLISAVNAVTFITYLLQSSPSSTSTLVYRCLLSSLDIIAKNEKV